MVQLSIVCTRGNAVRWYPVSGFLGMSEVQVTGIVRTRLEDDGRHLAGTCIDAAVRCYAERTGPGRNTIILAEYTATLWQKPPGRASEPIGDKDLPFTITVPKSCSAASTMNFQSYRVFWRVEATCHHLPMMGLGTRQLKSYELALVRYDSRRLPSAIATTPFQTTTTRGKKRQISVEHQIQLPNTPVGPLDIIPVTVRLRPFGDDGARVAALSLSVLRRLVFHDSPSTEDLFQRTRSENAHANSLFADHDDITPSGSDVTLLASASPANAPAPAPVTASSKSSVLVLATTEATSIGIDESDYHTKTLHVSLPPPKSLNHWALGETHSCALASISFHIAIKVSTVPT
ncbi:hypothetical protein BKA62DRAFT_625342 [Auriculariales sp. MPI-PUGE-AT-0066]|nr:hypothetical protein BKA62DRAFT_625342 [Auriculariales sp. MPI-PUGE-AT-0066]